MSLELRTEYWNDPGARAAFKAFMVEIHGLDFTAWESAGYWDDAYVPFSYFDGETVVASVCIYLLEVVVNGDRTRLAQVSGVGTLPRFRRQGLNRRLTDIGLDWCEGKHDGVFLFSDDEAIPFYERCGFMPRDEFVETIDATPVPSRDGVVKLDPANTHELDRIYAYAKRRTPVSNRFGVLNAKLTMFHVMYTLRNCVYEVPELDCLVFYERNEGRLSIFDIVGENVPRLEELYPYVADPSDKAIEFHFHADRLGLDDPETRLLVGNNVFVRDAFPLARPVFPFTSRA